MCLFEFVSFLLFQLKWCKSKESAKKPVPKLPTWSLLFHGIHLTKVARKVRDCMRQLWQVFIFLAFFSVTKIKIYRTLEPVHMSDPLDFLQIESEKLNRGKQSI